MARLFLGFSLMLLFLAAAFVSLPLARHAAGAGPPSFACLNAIDDDGDTTINDGCPAVVDGLANPAQTSEAPGGDTNQCDEPSQLLLSDDDSDGVGPPWLSTQWNDGCPQVNSTSEADIGGCGPGDNDNDDPGDDSVINDGCPVVGTRQEDGWQCNNPLDDDGDTVVNDGCPGGPWPAAAGPVGQAETINSCSNATDDDDLDGYINDGCPKVGGVSEGELAPFVGGIAELPDVGGSSGANYLAIGCGLAAAALAIAAGGWYARRRWLS
jgi:hypothetical protein